MSNDIRRDAITASIPTSRDLPCDCTTKLECLGDQNTGTALELDEPLVSFTSPDVTFSLVFVFELGSFSCRDFDRFQIMSELYFLVEDLLFGIIPTEQLRFCE